MSANRVSEIQGYYNARYADLGNEAFRPREAYPQFLDYIGVSSGKRLLDIGCGNGFLLAAAEEKGLHTYGVDISEAAVELACRNAPNSQISVGRMENLDYTDDYFDYVTCLGSIEHCLDIKQALGEMYRVTRGDSRLCIMVPNSNYIMWKLHRQAGTEQQDINEQLFSLGEWRSMLRNSDFIIERTLQDKWGASGIHVLWKQNPKAILRSIAMKTLWNYMPLRFTYQFIFICTKRVKNQ